jgi:hypothetical protein
MMIVFWMSSFGFLCGSVWEFSRGFDVMRWKTVGMLKSEMVGGTVLERDRAVKEICRRVRTGRMGVRDLGPVVDEILARQADDGKVWDRLWGDVVEVGRLQRRLADGQWERYLGEGPRWGIVRTLNWNSKGLRLMMHEQERRFGTHYYFPTEYEAMGRCGGVVGYGRGQKRGGCVPEAEFVTVVDEELARKVDAGEGPVEIVVQAVTCGDGSVGRREVRRIFRAE